MTNDDKPKPRSHVALSGEEKARQELDEHLAEAEARIADYLRDPSTAEPAYEALDRIARKRR